MIIRFLAVLLSMISINLMAINYVDQADNLLKQSNYDSSIYYYDLALKNCQNNCHDTVLAAIYTKNATALKLIIE